MKIGNLEVYGIIYKITNIINGKVYIGQTTDRYGFDGRYKYNIKEHTSNEHLRNAINKYGIDNFEINKIFDIAFSKNELDIKEDLWIIYCKSTNREYGYNKRNGGSYGLHTEESKENMREAQIKIPIMQLNLKGVFIREWSGAREASKKLNMEQSCIWACLNKERKTYKNFIWIHKEEYNKLNKKIDLDFYTFNRGQKIEIVQMDLQGNVIKIWGSANEAMNNSEEKFDCSGIIKVCKHKCATHKDYIFLYNKGILYDNFIEHINIINDKIKTKFIFQLSLNNEVVRIWKNAYEITNTLHISNIYNIINNKIFNNCRWIAHL